MATKYLLQPFIPECHWPSARQRTVLVEDHLDKLVGEVRCLERGIVRYAAALLNLDSWTHANQRQPGDECRQLRAFRDAAQPYLEVNVGRRAVEPNADSFQLRLQ